jgi:hypothetical protein
MIEIAIISNLINFQKKKEAKIPYGGGRSYLPLQKQHHWAALLYRTCREDLTKFMVKL